MDDPTRAGWTPPCRLFFAPKKRRIESRRIESGEESREASLQQTEPSFKDMLRDAVIQRFEFCVELAWKTSMKKLGLAVTAPKPAMREMGRAGLIEDVEKWLSFVDARNKSSHTYDKKIAMEVLDVIPQFLDAVDNLSRRISV